MGRRQAQTLDQFTQVIGVLGEGALIPTASLWLCPRRSNVTTRND